MAVTGGDQGEESWSRRQRLAVELRRLRDLAGISGRDLAQRMGISQSKVSRIESGATIPSLPEVVAWAKAVGASAETRERLIAVTEAAFTEVHTWRAALTTRTHLQDEIQEREARALTSRTFQPSLVPGLLQTAEYARRVFSMSQLPYTEAAILEAVAGRVHRQLALYKKDRKFEFLITEAALRWRPGPTEMLLAQLDRVTSLSTLSNVSIGLIPHAAQAVVPTSHGFVIYDGPEGDFDAFVTIETIHANLTVNDPSDVELYRSRWSLLRQMAVFDDEARKFLATLGTDLRDSAE